MVFTRSARSAALVLVVCAAAVPGAATATTSAPVPHPTAAAGPRGVGVTSRLAGVDRYGTAVAISRHRFPSGAAAVYLVSGAAYADAISAGMVADGPVLPVPSTGPVPRSVLEEIRRLDPAIVTAVGGTGVVPVATHQAAAQGRSTVRLAGRSRYETAAVVARTVYRQPGSASGEHETYFVNATPTADSIVAGVPAVPFRPILPVPAHGPAPDVIRSTARALDGGSAQVVGGRSAVSDATFASAAPGSAVRTRIAGADRYATSVAVAEQGPLSRHPQRVYLARGDVFADALAAGTLTDPVLLVPKSGPLPRSVAEYLRRTAPGEIVALGGRGAVSDGMLTSARNARNGRMPTTDIRIPNPYTAKDVLRPGWTVTKKAAATGELTCDAPSLTGVGPGTYTCGATYQSAHSCFGKPGYPNVVTCVTDPWRKGLLEYRLSAPLPRSAGQPLEQATPVAVDLSGVRCFVRFGGAWGNRGDDIPWAGCGQGDVALWTRQETSIVDHRLDGSTVQYRYGPWSTSVPLAWRDATVRYYLG